MTATKNSVILFFLPSKNREDYLYYIIFCSVSQWKKYIVKELFLKKLIFT